MLVTVAVVVTTHDLARGVLAGVLLSGIFFTGKMRRMFAVERALDPGGEVRYKVRGEIFFVSVDRFVRAFDDEQGQTVTIDVLRAHF